MAGSDQADVDIRALTAAAIPAAARLLARSMRDNPLHRRVFGASEARIEPLLEGAFVAVLEMQMRTGLVLSAWRDNDLVGVVGMAAPGTCRLGWHERFAMLRVLVRGRALHRLPHILRWLSVWMRRDPRFEHWHLGPAAVVRERQGQGVGSCAMAAVCAELDRRGAVGYLETDKPENVRLYRRGGFEVVAEQPVLGVTNWFMSRQPRMAACRSANVTISVMGSSGDGSNPMRS